MRSISKFLEATSSPIEKKFQEEVENYELVKFMEREYRFEIFSIDFAWPEEKIAVELDGFEYHKDRKDRDAYKDSRLKNSGWKVERFDGWFIRRHVNVAVAKVALKYLSKKLSYEEKKKALAALVTFWSVRDLEFAQKLIKFDLEDI